MYRNEINCKNHQIALRPEYVLSTQKEMNMVVQRVTKIDFYFKTREQSEVQENTKKFELKKGKLIRFRANHISEEKAPRWLLTVVDPVSVSNPN